MISEEKIRLMTDVALFEKRSQSEISDCRYRRRDFVSVHSLRVWMVLTLTYGIFTVLAVLYTAGEGWQLIVIGESFYRLLLKWGAGYLFLCIVGCFFSRIYYNRRYTGSLNRVHRLKELLRRLEYYERERSGEDDSDFTGASPENQ